MVQWKCLPTSFGKLCEKGFVNRAVLRVFLFVLNCNKHKKCLYIWVLNQNKSLLFGNYWVLELLVWSIILRSRNACEIFKWTRKEYWIGNNL